MPGLRMLPQYWNLGYGHGELVFDRQEVADMRAESWMKEWTAPDDNRDNGSLEVEELRALALKQPVIKCDLSWTRHFKLSTMLVIWGLIESARVLSKLCHTRAGWPSHI